ncbi:glycerol-3-phosphate 1-O-acyltransferase PlsY [Paracoccus sp. (in: a-proteobacteria)]|uniref:glycerol-3-phosphate 1-O-acyltransferase PlsY n=1 Tax=Paracoccus sp. TaxID=267 RepID=UPI0035B12BA3
MTSLILWAVIGYLLGSIPFGIVITRMLGLGDLRQIGSGNIGATNVLRTGNKPAALATLLLDSGKGAIAVLLARALAGDGAALIAGAAAFLGHLYPVWLNFKGGKGVATFLGTLLALDWRLGLGACAIWLATALVTRISSLSALVAAALSPLVALWLDGPRLALVVAFMAVLIFIRHRANIARIRTGTEPRIGKKT